MLSKQYTRILLVFGILVLGAVAWGVFGNQHPGTVVVLRDSGWYPRVLTVEPGETVTFVNKTKRPFWPASNSHPQHDLYPEFDAGQPLAPGKSWSFVFTREGKWTFHDHLRSYYAGVINVGQSAVTYDCSKDLEGDSVAAKRDCWNAKLLEEIETNGAQAAFRMFAGLYTSDPDLTKVGCHIIVHALGDAAYGQYVRNGKHIESLEFPPESVYCGYGYYHGLLEHMIRDTPDYNKSVNFCEWLIQNQGSVLPRIRLNCYHAIGHGFIQEPKNAEEWGNIELLTKPAIAACARIEALDTRQECYQGTFNVIADWMWNNQYGMRFPEDDPLAVCRQFDAPEVSRACYYEVSMRLTALVADDLPTLYTKYVASVPDDSIADMIINSAAASALGAHISENNLITFLHQCRLIPERARTGCLKGLSAAFIAHGEPEKEHVKAFAFCGDAELRPEEKRVCYWNVIRSLKAIYTPEKLEGICSPLLPEYRRFCAEDVEL